MEGRKVVASFDGGQMTLDAGAMLLGATDKQIRLIERFASCFTDYGWPIWVPSLVGQRVFGIAVGYEVWKSSRYTPVALDLSPRRAQRRDRSASRVREGDAGGEGQSSGAIGRIRFVSSVGLSQRERAWLIYQPSPSFNWWSQPGSNR